MVRGMSLLKHLASKNGCSIDDVRKMVLERVPASNFILLQHLAAFIGRIAENSAEKDILTNQEWNDLLAVFAPTIWSYTKATVTLKNRQVRSQQDVSFLQWLGYEQDMCGTTKDHGERI